MPNRPTLPSTTGLRVLLAVAEHGSASAAARALNMTQSAASKQLKAVEASAGSALFLRAPHGLALTEGGRIYVRQARIAMAALEAAAVSLAALRDAPQSIRLHVLPILGDRWLVPRFSGFAERYPEIDVQFTTFVTSEVAEEADGVFRFGEGVWPGHDAHYLFGRTVLLVGAPHLLQRQGPLATPADVARFPMLEHFQTPLRWSEFTQAHGIDAVTPSHTIRFGFYALVIRAAIFGQGLALVPKRLVEEELASGKLVNPCGLHFESRHAYYFTTPKGRKPKRELSLFRDWLIVEAGQKGGLDPAKELDACS